MGIGVLLIVAMVAIIIVGYQLWTGVPPYPSTKGEARSVVALLGEADLPDNPIIYELGCGWGTLVKAMAKAFPNATVIGIELSPIPWLVSRIRCRKLPNVQIKRKNFLQHPINDADAVTSYLMMKPMMKLADKLDRELRPGTSAVAVAFHFRDRQPHLTVRSSGVMNAAVALYQWPARIKTEQVDAHC